MKPIYTRHSSSWVTQMTLLSKCSPTCHALFVSACCVECHANVVMQGRDSQGASSMGGLYQPPAAAPRPITFPISLQQSIMSAHPQYSNSSPQRNSAPQQGAQGPMLHSTPLAQHPSYGATPFGGSSHPSFGSGSGQHQHVQGRQSFASSASGGLDPRQGLAGGLTGQQAVEYGLARLPAGSTGLRFSQSMNPEGPAPM